MTKLAIKLIRIYQYFSKNSGIYNAIPLFVQPQCRYYPTCSEYTIDSINKYGFLKGFGKGLMRVLKCNPLTPNR